MAGDRASVGKIVPTGCAVRQATGDKSGGTTLRQNAEALYEKWGIWVTPVFWASFNDMLDHLSEGRGVVVQISYRPIRTSAFAGSTEFTGGHAVYVNEYDPKAGRVLVYDPLADGRRAGIAQGPDWWPAILLKVAAGELVIGSSGTRVGFGRCWYAFTRVTHPVSGQTPLVTVGYGGNVAIATHSGITSPYVMSLSKGQSIYREPKVGAKVITKMSKAADVPAMGNAANGWRAVIVRTAGIYSDGEARPTIAYVPASAGEVTLK